MSGSKVHHLSTLLTAAQHCKHLLHFPTILLVLWLICCCHHHQCNAIKLFPVHEHDPANSFSKFVSYDGNLPAKFFSPAQQFDREDDDVTNALSDDQVSSLAISNQMVAEAFTEDECKEQKEKRAKPELLLPRRERRFSWDRWIHWFRPPSDRTSMGFMPVRGRKTTFIAARGKKSNSGAGKSMAMPMHGHNHNFNNHKHSTGGEGKTRYFLVALTVKPLLRSTAAVAVGPDAVLQK